MIYVLEKIKTTDVEKILSDAKCDPEKLQALRRFPILKEDPGARWVVDHERDSYLFRVHGKSGSDGSYLYFFQRKNLYEIELEGGLEGRLVKFVDSPHPIPPLLNELQQGIRDALAVYGRFGSGDGSDDWMLKVDAAFEVQK